MSQWAFPWLIFLGLPLIGMTAGLDVKFQFKVFQEHLFLFLTLWLVALHHAKLR